MSRDAPDVAAVAFAVVVVVTAVAVPASALSATAPAASTASIGPAEATDAVRPQTTSNGTAVASGETNDSVAPGQRLAGVIGVQQAEIDGEIGARSLSTRLSRADSNASKAAVVATNLNRIRDSLADLRDRQERLREAYRSGELSTGEYRARMAVTSASVRSVQRQLESTDQASRDLPDETLGNAGVRASELDRLRDDANELQGPEVAAMARQIAGEDPGSGLAAGRGPDELPEPARSDEQDDDGTERPGDGGSSAAHGDGNAANNRSADGGPPDETGNGNGGDAGNSEDAGKSGDAGNSDDAGNSGDAGNSDDAGNSEDAGKSGDAGNSDDAGNSEDAGNSDDAGKSGERGTSGDAGDSDGTQRTPAPDDTTGGSS